MSTIATANGTAADTQLENYIIMYVNGAWRISGYGPTAATNTTVDTADLAEWITYTGDKPQLGEVLTVGDQAVSVKKSTSAYDKKLIGIVTTNPHTVMSAETPNSVKLALSGRVPVKVSDEGGPIKAGDYVTSSSAPDVAMKATKAGVVVGKALEDWTLGAGKDTVMVLVNVSYVEPVEQQNMLASLTFDANGNLILPDVNPEDEVTALGGSVVSHQSSEVKKDLAWTLGDIVRRLTKLKEQTSSHSEFISESKTLKQVQGDNINGSNKEIASLSADLASLKLKTSSLEDKTSSLEAQLSTLNLLVPRSLGEVGALITNTASTSAQLGLENLDTKNATISGTLSVGGRTTLSDVGITGRMNIGLLSISGLDSCGSTPEVEEQSRSTSGVGECDNGFAASINTASGPLMLQSDGFNGVDMLNGKIVIDTKGNMKVVGALTVGKLNVDDGTPLENSASNGAVAAASIGGGIVERGDTTVTIKTTAITDKSRVFVTATSETDFPLIVIDKKAGQSFKVKIKLPATTAVKFDWWIVN